MTKLQLRGGEGGREGGIGRLLVIARLAVIAIKLDDWEEDLLLRSQIGKMQKRK
jgi:hypothetical protein